MASDLVTLAVAAATFMGLDPDMFCRLVQAESDWQVDALSPSGCVGLCQINMEAWKLEWVEEPLDPAWNLGKGAKILAWNLNYRLGRGVTGDEALRQAVASYNLGHGAVNKLLRKHGDKWMDALDEPVRKYVEKIVGEGG